MPNAASKPATSQIAACLRDLAAFASGFTPSTIAGNGDFEPTRTEARIMQDDLLLIAAKVDRVIRAYGFYLNAQGIVSERDVELHFTDTLANALEGNALWCIESGVNERVEAMRDAAE